MESKHGPRCSTCGILLIFNGTNWVCPDHHDQTQQLHKWHIPPDLPPDMTPVIVRTKDFIAIGTNVRGRWRINGSEYGSNKVIAWHPIPPLPLEVHNLLKS